MPKHDFMTPKAIGNRMKAAGLQRLRWYCQMCEKQCRDENGFRNHCSSDAHLRQMRLFAESPGRFLSDFSRTFEKGFMDVLSHRHGTKRVLANAVYQEYIADKQHIHMNATTWSSLSGFVQHLGREGKVIADETEKGWFVQFIERDPEIIAKKAMREKRQQAEIDEAERQQRIIDEQVLASAKNSQVDDLEAESNAFSRDESDPKIHVQLPSKRLKPSHFTQKLLPTIFDDNIDDNDETSDHEEPSVTDANPSITWLHVGIVVRIQNNVLFDGKYFGKKGTVTKIVNDFCGQVILGDGSVVLLDQMDLETVIPKVGGAVLICNGVHRGSLATVIKINESEFNCNLLCQSGPHAGIILQCAYEDFSKVADDYPTS